MYNNILVNNELSSTEKTVLLFLLDVATDNRVSMSLVELAESINITKPTLIKSLHSLQDKKMIAKHNDGGRYSKNIYKIN